MDAAAVEYIGTEILIPEDWLTFDITAEAANTSTAAGDYALRASYGFRSTGDDVSTGTTNMSPVTTTV